MVMACCPLIHESFPVGKLRLAPRLSNAGKMMTNEWMATLFSSKAILSGFLYGSIKWLSIKYGDLNKVPIFMDPHFMLSTYGFQCQNGQMTWMI